MRINFLLRNGLKTNFKTVTLHVEIFDWPIVDMYVTFKCYLGQIYRILYPFLKIGIINGMNFESNSDKFYQ